MKGAATGELAASMMKAERITSTIKMGASQNFFRTFIKSQNSLTRDINRSSCSRVIFKSELFLVSLDAGLLGIILSDPVRRNSWISFPIHRVFGDHTHDQSSRCNYEKEYNRKHYSGDKVAQDHREAYPEAINHSEQRWNEPAHAEKSSSRHP